MNKVCIKCNNELTDDNKVSGRNSCKKCEKDRRKNYVNKKFNDKICELCITKDYNEYCETCKNNILKQCIKCNEYKFPNKYKSILHKTCRLCQPRTKSFTKKEYLDKNPHITKKTCITCKELKNIDCFSYHINNFRNQCKMCISRKKYQQKYREKKIKEDKEKYLENQNKKHREWVYNNKEHCQKYNKEYNSKLERRVNNAMQKVKKKQEIKLLFKNLMVSECAYCGNNEYIGVDRIDSTKCYSFENCKPCCKYCNYMKNTMDIGSFLKKCTEIAIHNNLDNIELTDYRLNYHKNSVLEDTKINYYSYKHGAQRRNIDFNITQDEFLNIVKNNCYLCNKTNNNNTLGLDRVDNDKGYIIDNCKSCCKYCNYMKNKNELSKFLAHIQKIVKYTKDHPEYKNSTYIFYPIFKKTKHFFIN